MKKKFILILIICTCAVGIFFLSTKDEKTFPKNQTILTSHQIEPYLNLKGFDVEFISSEKIRIPIKFSGNFQKVADVSENLSEYKGNEVTCYTYKILSSDSSNVIAQLLVTDKDVLISAVVIEQTPNGFIKAI